MFSALPARTCSRSRRDIRRRALILTVVAIFALGFVVAALGPSQSSSTHTDTLSFKDVLRVRPGSTAATAAQAAEIQTRFAQGVAMLQMQQYEYALIAFHQVLKLAPDLPEAHVNMGFALIGLQRWRDAASFFETAIELRRDQMNAYYGLALALEAQGDLPGALGAMQTYVHRAGRDDPFRESAETISAKWCGRLRPAPEAADSTLTAPTSSR